ncbi:hypothetical protein [Streptomyces sp. NBC_00057]
MTNHSHRLRGRPRVSRRRAIVGGPAAGPVLSLAYEELFGMGTARRN